MKKSLILTFVVLCIMSVKLNAEFIHNPNKNTLWIENGENIKIAKRAKVGIWGGNLAVKERSGGGFSFIFNTEKPKSYNNGIYVPVNAAYPYLVFEIDSFTLLKGYRVFSFGSLINIKNLRCVMKGNIQTGLFVYNVFGNKTYKNSISYLRNDMHGLKVDFKYVKMVKIPENYIIIESEEMKKNKALKVGDKVKFIVKLKEPAEDVSLRFFEYNRMRQHDLNDRGALQLKPVDDTGKVWSANVTIEKLGRNRPIKAGGLFVKATVLGGGISVPIWTPIQYPVNPKKK